MELGDEDLTCRYEQAIGVGATGLPFDSRAALGGGGLVQDVAGAIASQGFEELPITVEDAENAVVHHHPMASRVANRVIMLAENPGAYSAAAIGGGRRHPVRPSGSALQPDGYHP